MKTVDLSETGARDFLSGSDGAYYTPVSFIEARCHGCRRWGHGVGQYHLQVLFSKRRGLVYDRHIVGPLGEVGQ